MIHKIQNSEKNRLVIIQFLDDNERQTGLVLANLIKLNSPYIGHVDFFNFNRRDNLLNFIKDGLSNYINNNERLVLYFDTHGNIHKDGINTKTGENVNWKVLIEALGICFKNKRNLPTLILTACNGIGIRTILEESNTPIVSKLIACDGTVEGGYVMFAFSQIFENIGFDINIDDIQEINKILKEKDINHPLFELFDYQNKINNV